MPALLFSKKCNDVLKRIISPSLVPVKKTDNPSTNLPIQGGITYNTDGTVTLTPPATIPDPANDPNTRGYVRKSRYRTHIVVNGVNKGYYEWGWDVDFCNTPPATVVAPVWTAEP